MADEIVPAASAESRLPVWRRRLVPVWIFLVALSFYQYELDNPPEIIWDEIHYINAARHIVHGTYSRPVGDNLLPYNWEHPPVGKYGIALGIVVAGDPHGDLTNEEHLIDLCKTYEPDCARDVRAWRLGSTVVGASGVAAIYLLGMRLFNRVAAGGIAAALLLLDNMYFLHARAAMLDVYATAFALWAFAFAYAPNPRGRWWAALAYGLALASKLSALFLAPVFLAVMFMRSPPAPGGAAKAWVGRLANTVALGAVVPVFVYAATYLPYIVDWAHTGGWSYGFGQWLWLQGESFQWGYAAGVKHSYHSPPLQWLPMVRPVGYYSHGFGHGLWAQIHSVGNPALWWLGYVGLVVVPARLFVRAVTGPGREFLRLSFLRNLAAYAFPWSRDLALAVGTALFYASYLPWFVLARRGFLFYMAFTVPFIALFAGGLAGEAWDRGGPRRLLAVLFVAVVAAVFVLFSPIVMGTPIPVDDLRWLKHVIPWMDAAG